MGQMIMPFMGGMGHGMSGGGKGGQQGGKGLSTKGMLPQLMQMMQQASGGQGMPGMSQGQGGMPGGGGQPGMMQPMQGGGPVPATNSMYNPQSGQFTGQKGTDWLKQQGGMPPAQRGQAGPSGQMPGQPPGQKGAQPPQMLKPPQKKPPQMGQSPLGQGGPSTPPNQPPQPMPPGSSPGAGSGQIPGAQGGAPMGGQMQGLSPQALADYKYKTAGIESNHGRAQDRPGSQYKGEYQLGTNESKMGMDKLTMQNYNSLKQALGRPPQPHELYLAHQQGAGGASSLLKNPSTPAGQLVSPSHISGNRGNPNAPASSFTNQWKGRYDRQTQNQPDHKQLWDQASTAIAQGAPHDKVMQRMAELTSSTSSSVPRDYGGKTQDIEKLIGHDAAMSGGRGTDDRGSGVKNFDIPGGKKPTGVRSVPPAPRLGPDWLRQQMFPDAYTG
jgi:hypothetical protein